MHQFLISLLVFVFELVALFRMASSSMNPWASALDAAPESDGEGSHYSVLNTLRFLRLEVGCDRIRSVFNHS